MIILTGENVTAERVTKALIFRLTTAGREHLLGRVQGACIPLDGFVAQGDPFFPLRDTEINFTKPHAEIWRELLSDFEGASTLHLLADDEYEMLGALTSAPIVVTKPGRDQGNALVSFDAVFWFPNYQIESELETLLRTGAVSFELASEPQDLLTCDECGLETYDLEAMQSHKCERSQP